VWLIGSDRALADYIFAPPIADTTPGGTASDVLGRNDGGHDRFQQVYQQKLFSSEVLISQISFRAAASGSFTFPSVIISLSTTGMYPINDPTHPHLGSVFQDNLGPNNTVVYQGALTYSSTGSPATNFDFVINLTTPFRYDPTQGNLLFDFQSLDDNLGGKPLFEATQTNGLTLSSVFGDADPGQDLTTGDPPTGLGLDTRFAATPVPEPSTLVLFTLAGAAVAFRARRRLMS
jgi:hypothetical protein